MGILENLLGFVLLAAFGALFFWLSKNEYERKDYSKYQTTIATVIHTEDFIGDRWIVHFIDHNGDYVLAMDDEIAGSTFNTNKWCIPKQNTTERIYYWPYEEQSNYRINGEPIKYWFHFCDDALYDLIRNKRKKILKYYKMISIALFVCACMFLFFV